MNSLKNYTAKTLKTLHRCIAASVLTLAALQPLNAARADQQGYPSTLGSITNLIGFMPSNWISQPYEPGTTNLWTNTVPIHANSGFSYTEIFQQTNMGGGGGVTSWFYPTTDGANYWTSPWASLFVPCNSTNIAVGGTNWSQLQLRGFLGFSVVVSNGCTSAIYSTGLISSVTFGTTNGNSTAGFYWNRPNQ